MLFINRDRRFRIASLCILVGAAGPPALARQGITFAPSTIDASNAGDCKAIADIDGDGKGDPILGGPALGWYESGAGFARRTIRATPVYGEFTTDMQAVDVDGDGDPDLVVGDNAGAGNVMWFENPRINPPAGLGADPRIAANWTYHIIGTHGATTHDVEVADLDNDGRMDVVTSGHGQTHIWKQVNPTTWLERNLSSIAGAGVFLGDIDRDGFKDIATPRGWIRNPQTIATGAWTFFPIAQATAGDECLLADLNGDGRLDLMSCDAHNRGPMVWFEAPSKPTGTAWVKRSIDSSMAAHHPEAVDFDRDGKMDILMGLELSEIAIYMNIGGTPPTFSKVQIDNGRGHNARTGDIDGDGMPDVFGCDYLGHPPARIYINNLSPAIPCYPNCDGSEGAPILTANDFQCFVNAYALGGSYANCDGSTGMPPLTGNDFLCFINAYAFGCS